MALVGCKVVRLQSSGMVLYDLPAIRSVALVWLQGCGDSALWSARHQIGVALVGCKVVRLQGSGMVLYDLPAIRSVWLLSLHGSGDRIKRAHCK